MDELGIAIGLLIIGCAVTLLEWGKKHPRPKKPYYRKPSPYRHWEYIPPATWERYQALHDHHIKTDELYRETSIQLSDWLVDCGYCDFIYPAHMWVIVHEYWSNRP